MTKPILAVDIDDCLSDYVGAFLPFLAEHGINIKREEIVNSFCEMDVPDTLFDEFQNNGNLLKLKTVRDSEGCILALSKKYSIVAITSRHPRTFWDTNYWMVENFPGVEFTVFSTDKGKWCTENNAWGLIDDQVRFAKQFHNSLVISQPWNEYWYGKRGTWNEITADILYSVDS